ncbi:hypothetical protein [Kitasatospora sp. NPDC056181]|uniref:hypothetical protein n=1 Tax=Kitasatospora sp. NPDC056181 TaxID=3345737 RepID=UPI0035DE3E62
MAAATITRPIARQLLYAVLCGWGGLTVLRQMGLGRSVLVRLKWAGRVVPNYRFFGPTPSMHDLHILVRDRLSGGQVGLWRELDVAQERRAVHVLWAPHRRVEKALLDAAREMAVIRRRSAEARQWKTTIPYLALLNVATFGVPHESGAWQTQFAIARAAAYEQEVEPEILFVSDFHDLDTGPGVSGTPARSGGE